MNSLGRHILVEYYGCSKEILTDAARLEEVVVKAAKDAGATVLNSTFHHFSPVGTSGVVVIQESHLAIHTWPEFQYAAVDLFTCGDQINPWISYESLKGSLESSWASPLEMLRGQIGMLPKIASNDENHENHENHEYEDEPVTQVDYNRNVWFTEWEHDSGLSLKHRGSKLVDMRSKFQKLEVFDTYKYGKMMALDGVIVTTEKDEYVYHEMMAHPAMQVLPDAKRALVIGGGDGGIARELLRYDQIEEVVVAEIDEEVINVTKQHFPQLASSFGDQRTKLEITNGVEFVRGLEPESFDLIIVDSPDPVGSAKGLFSTEFYADLHRILSAEGILITQSESPRFNEQTFCDVAKCHRQLFGQDQVWTYLAFIPTYTSGMWSFSLASKSSRSPLAHFDDESSKSFSKAHGLRYYNEEIHRAAFVLPTYVREMLEQD